MSRTSKDITIKAPKVRSLCWSGETLVDWASGGTVLHMDGTVEAPPARYAYDFNAAAQSPCGNIVVIYDKLGTKALVLERGQVLREINRSFYHAHAYEYPIALTTLPGGEVVLAHCPIEYRRLQLEDARTGEHCIASSTDMPVRKSPDYFQSRLRFSADGSWLLSAGWVWHPWDTMRVFDAERALLDPRHLDTPVQLPNFDGEVASAEFLSLSRVLVATSEESLDEDEADPASIPPNRLTVIDIRTQSVVSSVPASEPVGNLMPVDEFVAVGFHGHPKLFSLDTGAVLARWPRIDSGNQNSSIIWNGVKTPPIAVDPPNRRFAVAHEDRVSIVYV